VTEGDWGVGDRAEPDDVDPLDEVLADAVRLGFLSARPRIPHRVHAEAFLPWLDAPGTIVDLGTGGGVPGLVIAWTDPDRPVVCVESRARRAAFLRVARARLCLQRVSVVDQVAEAVTGLREQAAAVTARGFGPPGVVAECAVPFVKPDGRIIVSDPPGGGDTAARWPEDGLQLLGLVVEELDAGPPALTVLRRVGLPKVTLPRGPGGARRAPLF
jgi:16S rRNA (guanine527-N7)-methyltransferase